MLGDFNARVGRNTFTALPSSAPDQSCMIDLLLMRAKQRFCCRDVQVMRSATCCTDHNLVRAKLKIDLHAQDISR